MTGIVGGGQQAVPFDRNPYPPGASLFITQKDEKSPITVQVAPAGFQSVKPLVSLTDPQFTPTPTAQQQWAFEANVCCDALNVLLALATKMEATVPPGKKVWKDGITPLVGTLRTAVKEGHLLCISTAESVNTPPQ